MQKVIEAKESTNAQVLRRAGTKQIKRGPGMAGARYQVEEV